MAAAVVAGRAIHPVRFVHGIDGTFGPYRREIRLSIAAGVSDIVGNYTDTSETVTEYEDFLGRVYRIEYPVATGSPPAVVRTFSVTVRRTRHALGSGIRQDG